MTLVAVIAIPQRERHAECTAGITSSRLDPDAFKGTLSQDAAVGDTVEGDAASHAEVRESGFLMCRAGHAQHDLLGDYLA